MHVYKLQAGAIEEKDIERTAFERDTRKLDPWYQVTGDKQHEYAVCPACDNPIQIIGLYEELPHTDRPYGRHSEKEISGFSYFEEANFTWCPYVRGNKSKGSSEKRGKDGISLQILGIVLTQFDRVIYIIRKETGIWISPKIALAMLENWIEAEGYRFHDATLRNIPWMFAYRSKGLSIFGQQIIKGQDELRQAITKCIPHARFDEKGRITKGDQFYQVTWCFVDYRRKTEDGSLIEMVEFEVCDGDRNVVFAKTITFDPRYFANLINYSNPDKREPELIAKAKEVYDRKFDPDFTRRIVNLVGGFDASLPKSIRAEMMPDGSPTVSSGQ
ncbi:hypothetical protein AUP42_01745 [Thalassospira lucentensis]|uniref:Uncharacterized protein n=1 Tax=Thalassospira lucentensis TaxID=168935 RepID=A0A154L3F6_9PROT|nr:hypothetical protein [Thalassospira lucentensis]KZB63141.1 hypothetical protein AUP42_01745 [Thalassospira lucentensis]